MKPVGTITRVQHDFGKSGTKWAWAIDAQPHIIMRLKRIFPRVKAGQHDTVYIADSAEVCRELVWLMQRFQLTASPLERLVSGAEEHRERERVIAEVISGTYKAPDFELAHPPRDYQKVCADLWLRSRSLLCGDDLGLGKTIEAIIGLTDKRTLPAVVVTMTHLPKQWKAQLNKFAPNLTVYICPTGKPIDLRAKFKGRLPDVVVINYHKLVGWAGYLASFAHSVIFDEVQELRKGAGTDKYDSAKTLAEAMGFRLGLSATPIYNYGAEIFNVMDAVAPGALGTAEEFRTAWCTGADYSGNAKMVADPRAFGTYLREQGLMLRRTRAEVGRELPDLTRVPHEIDADLREIEKVADAASQLARIILAAGGEAVKGEKWRAAEELSWKLRQATGIAKAPFVAEFVKMLVENGEKVVLYGWHREVYGIWMQRLGDLKPALYTGSESASQKAEAARRFTSGETPVLIMSLRAGAGLDGLQHHCRNVVFGELDWSPEVHNQCIGRLHRDEQREKVMAYFLWADSGSDPSVMDVLAVKREQAELIRDPTRDIVDQMASNPAGHVRKLAEQFLKSRGERVAANG